MATVTAEAVFDSLRDVYDPEIPVNIVDLGLVYDVQVNDDKVSVKITLTSPFCGMGDYVAEEAKEKILSTTGATEADVEVVFDPPWTPELISDEGKKVLGWA